MRLCKIARVAHASRVLATPNAFGVANFSKDCFGETPKPTRETRALPRKTNLIHGIFPR
jgi:hypothetical protein